MRTAVIPSSRVYYKNVLPAVKALIMNSDVEQIILTIEDDEFPEYLPPQVKTINVSGQTYFPPGGPNVRNQYVYLCLLRCAYADLFPDLDRVLALDADAFVVEDIGRIPWDMDMEGKYLAGVQEAELTWVRGRPYINMGAAIFNLDQMRKDNLHTQMIEALNNRWYMWVEQDCLNEFCYPHIITLGPEWNSSQFTQLVAQPKIRHCAYEHDWKEKDPFLYFDRIPWGQVRRVHHG